MRQFIFFFLIIFGTCSVYGDVSAYENAQADGVLVRHPRQLNILGGTRRLIEQLVENVRLASKQANESIAKFTSTVQAEAVEIEQKIENDIDRLRGRVSQAIEYLTNRLIDSGVAVVECIAIHRDNATALFNETIAKAMSCVESNLAEVREQIQDLTELTDEASAFASTVMNDMKTCTEENEGYFISTGACLGTVAVQSESQALMYGTQMTIAIGSINLALATLPASLEMCAGARLVESSVSTAKIIMEIGSCSASSVYASLTGPYPYTSTTSAPSSVEPISVEPISVEPISVEPVSIEPVSLSIEPVSVSIEPVSVSIEPVSVSIEPVSVSSEPVSVSIEPVSVSVEPVSVSIEPISVSIEPVSVSNAPISSTETSTL